MHGVTKQIQHEVEPDLYKHLFDFMCNKSDYMTTNLHNYCHGLADLPPFYYKLHCVFNVDLHWGQSVKNNRRSQYFIFFCSYIRYCSFRINFVCDWTKWTCKLLVSFYERELLNQCHNIQYLKTIIQLCYQYGLWDVKWQHLPSLKKDTQSESTKHFWSHFSSFVNFIHILKQ